MELFVYYYKLSIRNLARNPLFFTLMITTLSIGVGILLANIAILDSMSGDPIPQKSDRLYNVSMNGYPNKYGHQEQPFYLLRYRDAMQIVKSDIPSHSMAHYLSRVFTRDPQSQSLGRITASLRATTKDFFALTNAPFAQGQGWQQDNSLDVVISARLNQKLFAGNGLGQSLDIEGKLYRVVGVLKQWQLKPLFYHATEGRAFNDTADIFMSLESAINNNWASRGNIMTTERFNGIGDSRDKNVFFVQAYVQLDNAQQKNAFENYLNNYSQDLKDRGLHPLPVNNKLYDVKTWLSKSKVVDERMQAFALATMLFLAVCIFNASSLLLSRYHAARFETGLRRAVGASKKQIFYQGLVESLIIGIVCAVFALILGGLFLYLSKLLFPHLDNIAELNFKVVAIGMLIAISTTLLSTLYPLFRASSVSLSSQLN